MDGVEEMAMRLGCNEVLAPFPLQVCKFSPSEAAHCSQLPCHSWAFQVMIKQVSYM